MHLDLCDRPAAELRQNRYVDRHLAKSRTVQARPFLIPIGSTRITALVAEAIDAVFRIAWGWYPKDIVWSATP